MMRVRIRFGELWSVMGPLSGLHWTKNEYSNNNKKKIQKCPKVQFQRQFVHKNSTQLFQEWKLVRQREKPETESLRRLTIL